MNKIIYMFAAMAALASCSAKYCGTYEGVLPAADGPGIATKLQLDANGEYRLNSLYIDKKDGKFVENGRYSVDGDIIAVSRDGQNSYYKAEDRQLRMLDMDKEMIHGPLADFYILKKTESCK